MTEQGDDDRVGGMMTELGDDDRGGGRLQSWRMVTEQRCDDRSDGC